MTFREAIFAAGEVRFEDAEFAAGLVDFTGARFTGATVNFGETYLPTRYWTVPAARFTGGTVNFRHVDEFTHPPRFGLTASPSGLQLPPGTDIANLP